MPFGQSAVGHRGLDPRGQIEQPQGIGHRRARSTDARRESVLGEPEFVDQLAVCVGRLDRIEILPL